MKHHIEEFSVEELERELLRRQLIQDELQRRIYCGELEATDGDRVTTMNDLS